MSEFKKTATSKKSIKSKGPAAVARISKSVASTTAVKKLPCASTSHKINKDSTVSVNNCVGSMPDSPQEYCQTTYGQALEAILADCNFESITPTPRKENELEVKMSLLMQRLSKTTCLLDETCKRLKEISFVNELERLQDFKNNDCKRFLEQVCDIPVAKKVLQRITDAEHSCLDQLEPINMDCGYNKESGPKQLLDVLNETINGLKIIKKSSTIDLPECAEYEKSQSLPHQQEKDRLIFEELRAEHGDKFPKLTKEFLFDASVKLGKMVEQSYDSDN